MGRSKMVPAHVWSALYQQLTYENALAIRTALETGLRINDVLQLRPDQISEEQIRGVSSKTGKRYKKQISKELGRRLKILTGKEWVFEGRKNGHRTRQAVYKDLNNACKRLGLPGGISPHSTRKTYAAQITEREGLEAAKRELQHDRIETTMLYAMAESIEGQLKAALDKSDVNALAEKIAQRIIERLSSTALG